MSIVISSSHHISNNMQIRKNEAIPEFLNGRPIDPTVTLEYIITQLSGIYTAAKTSDSDDNDDKVLHIDHDTYAKIYTAVFNYLRTPEKRSTPQSSAAKGEFLFQHLSAEIKGYCEFVRSQMLSIDSGIEMVDAIRARKVLIAYMSCYHAFTRLAALVKGVLRYWDRHWMRQQWDDKKIPVRSVEELHKMVWKEEVLEQGGLEVVVDAIAVLRKPDGGMAEYDSVLVKDVVKSLSGLSITLEG